MLHVILVRKAERTLTLVRDGLPDARYAIVLGHSSVGSKEVEGDGRTPEGEFYVAAKNPKSKYHLSVCLSYPDVAAAERGLRDGLITTAEHNDIIEAIKNQRLPPQDTSLGGAIYIHGGGIAGDWTEGCIAVENEDMTEIYEAVEIGTPVTVLP